MSNIDILRKIAKSTITIDFICGFDFKWISGGLYKFTSMAGDGICYKKENDSFKQAKCMFL